MCRIQPQKIQCITQYRTRAMYHVSSNGGSSEKNSTLLEARYLPLSNCQPPVHVKLVHILILVSVMFKGKCYDAVLNCAEEAIVRATCVNRHVNRGPAGK